MQSTQCHPMELRAYHIKDWRTNLRGSQGGSLGGTVGKKGHGENDVIAF